MKWIGKSIRVGRNVENMALAREEREPPPLPSFSSLDINSRVLSGDRSSFIAASGEWREGRRRRRRLEGRLESGPARPDRKKEGIWRRQQGSHDRARVRSWRPIAIFLRSSLSRCTGFDFFSFIEKGSPSDGNVWREDGGGVLGSDPEEQTHNNVSNMRLRSYIIRLGILSVFLSILS